MGWDGHHQIKSIESSDQMKSEKIWAVDCTCSPSEAKRANRPHDDDPQIFAHHSHSFRGHTQDRQAKGVGDWGLGTFKLIRAMGIGDLSANYEVSHSQAHTHTYIYMLCTCVVGCVVDFWGSPISSVVRSRIFFLYISRNIPPNIHSLDLFGVVGPFFTLSFFIGKRVPISTY